ncbi:MAG: sigma-70 family RNA polymerase sigma factor, partial [Actinomycetota bacterium]|nr:sigma-70 family RNA polymerase sigma factor [Actinomycetota bacterium]
MTYTLTVDARFEDSARADSTLALVTSDGMALSWGDVFDEYAPALTAFARSRGVREPEDLVQDVFVAAVQQLRDFKGDRSGLRSLLFTIAYRRVADEHRRFYRRREKLVAEHSPSPDPGPTIEQVIGLGESARRALQAFAVLTDRERRVIQMRILEEASPAKVGQTLGLSSGNVRVIQARALAKIRMHLTSTGEKGLTQMMVIGGTLTDFVRYLRAELPPDDVLKPWIEELGANSSPRALEGTALATSATMASSSVAAAERVTEAAYSLFSTVISSGATRIGAVVSVVAMSTLPLAPALLGGAELSSPSDNPLPVVEVQEASPTPLETADEISRDGTEPPVDQPVPDNPVPDNPVPDNPVVDNPVPDNPVPSGSVANNAPPPSDSIRDFDATEGTGPPAR